MPNGLMYLTDCWKAEASHTQQQGGHRHNPNFHFYFIMHLFFIIIYFVIHVKKIK